MSSPKSRSSGMDLFILDFFTKNDNATLEDAKRMWKKQSSKNKKIYEKQAHQNLKQYFQSSATEDEEDHPYTPEGLDN